VVNLAYRAERALLGALLQDPDQIDDGPFVTVADFESPNHQRVFTAIRTVGMDQRGGIIPSRDLGPKVAALDPELDLEYLHAIRESCPRPGNGTTYARMVMEASLCRQLAAHARHLFEAAGKLHYDMARFTITAKSDNDPETFLGHMLKLAGTLLAHAREFGPGIIRGTPPTPGRDAEQGEHAQQEEEVLADLIHNFWSNNQVLEWLPAEAFAPGPRRAVYQAIIALARNGEPVDELTVDWQLARNRILHPVTASNPRQAPIPEPDYAAHLAAITVPEGTATLTGHTLFHRHVAAQLHAQMREPGIGENPSPAQSPITGAPPSFGGRASRAARPPQLRWPPGTTPGNSGPEPRP
jgi:hypothetical protein